MPVPTPKDEDLPDFFRYDIIEKRKTEVLSCRIEYDSQLPFSKSIAIPFSFFHFNSQLDRYTIDWYTSSIKTDLKDENDKIFFMLPHRHIMTGDSNAFNFNGRSFDRIDIIFGKEFTYWRFSFPLPSGESYEQCGRSLINIGNCPCCIGKQYKRIIEKVREDYNKDIK